MTAKADKESEKPEAAAGAEPTSMTAVKKPDDEFDFATFRDNAGIMFPGVREFVIDGAFMAANMDKSRTYTKEQVQKAIDDYMKREVK